MIKIGGYRPRFDYRRGLVNERELKTSPRRVAEIQSKLDTVSNWSSPILLWCWNSSNYAEFRQTGVFCHAYDLPWNRPPKPCKRL